eukprot:9457434-Pyramimonas_sp.AAC.1
MWLHVLAGVAWGSAVFFGSAQVAVRSLPSVEAICATDVVPPLPAPAPGAAEDGREGGGVGLSRAGAGGRRRRSFVVVARARLSPLSLLVLSLLYFHN